jgi:hypothetical protein
MRWLLVVAWLAPAAWSQTSVMVAVVGDTKLEADVRTAAVGLLDLMTSGETAEALKDATESGMRCGDEDIRC